MDILSTCKFKKRQSLKECIFVHLSVGFMKIRSTPSILSRSSNCLSPTLLAYSEVIKNTGLDRLHLLSLTFMVPSMKKIKTQISLKNSWLTRYGLGMLPVTGQHFQFVWYKLKYPSASTIPN